MSTFPLQRNVSSNIAPEERLPLLMRLGGKFNHYSFLSHTHAYSHTHPTHTSSHSQLHPRTNLRRLRFRPPQRRLSCLHPHFRRSQDIGELSQDNLNGIPEFIQFLSANTALGHCPEILNESKQLHSQMVLPEPANEHILVIIPSQVLPLGCGVLLLLQVLYLLLMMGATLRGVLGRDEASHVHEDLGGLLLEAELP